MKIAFIPYSEDIWGLITAAGLGDTYAPGTYGDAQGWEQGVFNQMLGDLRAYYTQNENWEAIDNLDDLDYELAYWSMEKGEIG